jgi:tetratricopeptide (TPR) repeat protein
MAKKQRPGGITLLGLFQILAGGSMLLMVVWGNEGLSAALNGAGFSSQKLIWAVALYGLVVAAGGIGTVLGKTWGWWLTAFYCLYNILRHGSAFLIGIGTLGALENMDSSADLSFLNEMVRVVGSGLAAFYWFSPGILDYFGLADLSRRRALSILGGIAIIVFAGLSLPSSADRELERIAKLYEQGDLPATINGLEGYLESNPDDDMAWTILGRAHTKVDAYNEAEAAYDRALEINPERYQAWTGLGILNDWLGNPDRAMECYENALEINPDHAETHTSLSILAIQIYQDDIALEHAEKAHELDRRDPVIAANLAVVYHYNGMYEERNAMTAEAERLGYEDIGFLYELYEGEWTLRQ